MKVAGFTIIRNALKFDYPVVEAITSVLPVCDTFFVGVGNSEDGTLDLVKAIDSKKLVIIESKWDDTIRTGGLTLSTETNKVFDAIPAEFDWCFYIQSDESVHENDLDTISKAMILHHKDQEVDGLLFNYHHFYGQYQFVGTGREWYAREIRIIRNNKSIRSYKDAQGFRKSDGSKLRVKDTKAYIYHYGWVKPPGAQQKKQQHFHKMWHEDQWVKENIAETEDFDYSQMGMLEVFQGTHPAAMQERIARAKWKFNYDHRKAKVSIRNRILHFVESVTGWRVGENKNYKLMK
jgi:hypothetical protein